jgi:hypothetical protein
MLDLRPLNGLREQVRTPSYQELRATARRRNRRAALSVLAGLVIAVMVVVGAVVVGDGSDRSAPTPVVTPTPIPTPRPTPAHGPKPSPSPVHHPSATSMTPKEVVLADNAQLVLTGVSADDPDFRLSIWQAMCTWCPKASKETRAPHPSFYAMAITADGFGTATYRRAPFADLPIHVESVGPRMLLIVDTANSGEWLVRDDGTVTALARDFDEVPAADPRLWFVCLASRYRPPGGQAIPYDSPLSWCALQPHANAVHIWGAPWKGSGAFGTPAAVPPSGGTEPWGISEVNTDRLVAWWEAAGTRHERDLGPSTACGTIANSPKGIMSFWSWSRGSHNLEVFTSADRGGSWHQASLHAPYRPLYSLALSWTPNGGLLARQDDAFYPDGSAHEGDGIRLWRSPSATRGGFTAVYESRSGNLAVGHHQPAFTVVHGRLWSHNLWSDDDGARWTEVPSWR